MLYNRIYAKLFFASLLLITVNACNNSNDKKTTTDIKKDTIEKKAAIPEKRITPPKAPVINITDTVSIKQLVLCMKDSAANSERIGIKLAAIYGVKLGAVIKKKQVKSYRRSNSMV